MIHAGLATMRDFVKEHREWVRGFLQGYIEAVRYAATNPKEPNKLSARLRKQPIRKISRNVPDLYQGVGARPLCLTAGVQSVLNFTRHPRRKGCQAGTIYRQLAASELEKSGFVNQSYGR